MDSPEEKLHNAMFGNKPTQAQQEEIPTPTVQENIDWSEVIANAQSEVDEVLNGTYYDDEDSKQWIYESVMQAVFGKDYFKWFNKNT